MTESRRPGRRNQKNRTRKDLLSATSRLVKRGHMSPTLEEIAEEAQVSRATVYRYFPNVEAALVEAALDTDTPSPAELFADGSTDPIARVSRVDVALHEMVLANEASLRLMLVHSLQRPLKSVGDAVPTRQNRRTPLLEEALAPLNRKVKPATMQTLLRALALIVGTEAMIVFKDVLRVKDRDARAVKRWAIAALIQAAIRSGSKAT